MGDLIPFHPVPKSPYDLPVEVRTFGGVTFDPRLSRWSFRDNAENVSLTFDEFAADEILVENAKKAFVWYAINKSAPHLRNMFYYFAHFLKSVRDQKCVSVIDAKYIINYKGILVEAKAYYLGSLSGFLQKWHSLGLPGVTDNAVALLKQLRIKGNQKGEAVLTMDSENGPYTDIELGAIRSAIDTAYESNAISLGDYLLVWLFMALGQRPIQYAALKVCDVGMEEAKDGTIMYTLRVPRAKQRGRLSRELFSQRVLIPQIGEKLVQYANEVRAAFSGILSDSGNAPLFPANRSRQNEPVGFEHHRTSNSLASTLEGVLNKLDVLSERTGEPLHVTATRFRRTIGTRAAEEGHGELVIAELLDHADTQNVGVYVQATPEIVKRIDKAVAMHMAPLAQAFAGVIISHESEATRKNDPASRICDPRFEPSMKPMGNCGKHGFCGFLAPIACYTCRSFEPWLDGPHEAVLNHLIAERDRLMAGNDARIASINDRTILAVAEVVRRCEEIRSEESLIV